MRAGDKAEPQATSRLCGRISASVTYAHPLLEHVLRRTLGVPLFQEQLIRMAMIVANFSGREAEELRRAMGMRRSQARMRELEAKLRKGMTDNGVLAEKTRNMPKEAVKKTEN